MIPYPLPKGYGAFYRLSQRSNNYELTIFIFKRRLHDQRGPRLTRSVCRGRSGLLWCSHVFLSVPGAEVDDAWEGSQRCCFVICPCLAAKSSHVRVDVDGLACSLHHPTICNCQTRGWVFMSGTALSRHAAAGGGAFRGMRSPRTWIFAGVLTVWVPVSSSFYVGTLFLLVYLWWNLVYLCLTWWGEAKMRVVPG
jgi:hypothetical protein